MVHIPRLLAAIEALVWRHGAVKGNELKHRFEPDGSLVITVSIAASLIDAHSIPRKPDPNVRPSWGMTAPDLRSPKR
jgi:hypothetical protein